MNENSRVLYCILRRFFESRFSFVMFMSKSNEPIFMVERNASYLEINKSLCIRWQVDQFVVFERQCFQILHVTDADR